ncbi:MAG TPA: AAA domain-containing protein, partial [Chondromyces sp.]|nr:AAA domain-containing protein [Chondromyces sp.]
HWEVPFFEGTPIRLQYREDSYKGTVLSFDGRSLMVELEAYLGEEVAEATLFSEPWELLQQLSDRIEDASESDRKRRRIENLLFPVMKDRHPYEKVKNTVHETALRAKYNPVTYIWGPPGTGKTYTLSRAAANLYVRGKRVLIMGHSNASVDVLVRELAVFLQEKERWTTGDVIRYGAIRTTEDSVFKKLGTEGFLANLLPDLFEEKERLEEEKERLKASISKRMYKSDAADMLELEKKLSRIRERWKKEEEKVVEKATVIATTLSKAAIDPAIYNGEFDIAIIDEASMAYVPQIAFAASLAKHIVVCGDFKQLPPIAVSRHPLVAKWLKKDIFEHAGMIKAVQQYNGHPHLLLLKEQRRMHPDISAFTNKVIYEGRVGDDPGIKSQREDIASKAPFREQAAVLVNTHTNLMFTLKDKYSSSRYNLWSLFTALQLMLEAKMNGLLSIGYISPYRIQARLMNVLLASFFPKEWAKGEVAAATVHRFQGSERDMIVFDTVDSSPQPDAGALLTGKESERLVNVAVTRARGKFLLLADSPFLEKNASSRTAVRQLHSYLKKVHYQEKQTGQSVHKRLQWYERRDDRKWLFDIIQAKRRIVIGLPPKMKPTSRLWAAVKKNRHNVHIKVLSKYRSLPVPSIELEYAVIPFPFILIDEKIFWLGAPLSEGEGKNVRMVSSSFVFSFLQVFDWEINQQDVRAITEKEQAYQFERGRSQSLSEYMKIWDSCPYCSTARTVHVTKNGYVRLECENCEQGEFISERILNDYLNHADVTCTKCKGQLAALWSEGRMVASCSSCGKHIPLSAL